MPRLPRRNKLQTCELPFASKRRSCRQGCLRSSPAPVIPNRVFDIQNQNSLSNVLIGNYFLKITMRKIIPILLLLIFCASVFAQVRVAPLNIRERTLSNGLKVVSVQDNSSPTVSIHVWYNVGGKNDPVGRSGFAHLFEHLMFKSTKNMPGEKMDRLTEDVGGFNNASTWPDYTNYFEVVPSNHLETLLWAESDRMA